MKKLLLAGVVTATLLTGCGDSSDNAKIEKNTANATKKEEKETKAYVGDTITLDNVKVTFSNMEKAAQIGDAEFPTVAKGEYLILNITIENASKKSITTSSEDFKLYINKAQHSMSEDTYTLDDCFTGGDISPNTKIENKKMIFDIQKGADLKGAYIEWKPNMFDDDKTVKIYLQK